MKNTRLALTTVRSHAELNAAAAARGIEPPKNCEVGFVPTMGALHEGHLSLIRRSIAENDVTVVSIFVNPLQFSLGEDLERYPQTLDHDKKLLQEAGADILFLPDVSAMYPGLKEKGAANGSSPMVTVHAGPVGERFEGKARPGHFDGVLTVVAKLFHLCRPCAAKRFTAYFGQKDAQQAFLIRAMVRDLNFPVRLKVTGTVRAPLPRHVIDGYFSEPKAYEAIPGLALSSRNQYLSSAEADAALVISQSLKTAYDYYAKNNHINLTPALKLLSGEKRISLEYFEIVDASTFAALDRTKSNVITSDVIAAHAGNGILAIIAVRIGKTRLLDNLWIIETSSG